MGIHTKICTQEITINPYFYMQLKWFTIVCYLNHFASHWSMISKGCNMGRSLASFPKELSDRSPQQSQSQDESSVQLEQTASTKVCHKTLIIVHTDAYPLSS